MQDFSSVFKDLLSRMDRLSKRLTSLETHEYIKLYPILGATDYLVHQTILDGVTYTSANLRGVQGVSAQAKGFFGVMWITPSIATVNVYVTPGNDTPSAYSQQYKWSAAVITSYYNYSQMVMCPLGPDGDIKIKPSGANAEVFMIAHGYWM